MSIPELSVDVIYKIWSVIVSEKLVLFVIVPVVVGGLVEVFATYGKEFIVFPGFP